ncbi:MAG: prepilin-type N-terminal cleavage/methylation domain-containing protein, partial [Deltaproteobacteria bacterium]|nr:prepilin-type N-terminal cleavage/methylation domain-containing protein [Deltaproteobacteria bacterium]
MSSKKSILLKSQGFTLVELLIVVAIIGVLASQGVPAYRRMIMKSRKGEAQIMLGNIATAESAFFSEYGSYGDHLDRMGATMEGAQFVYAAGVNV